MLILTQMNNEVDFKQLVLILGRDKETRLMMKTLLELWNYQTIEARNVRETAFFLERFSPNLILMDSDHSFTETLKELTDIRRNEKLKAIPVVIISSFSQRLFRDIAIANGADYFFAKPVNFSRLEKSLKNFIAQVETSGEENFESSSRVF